MAGIPTGTVTFLFTDIEGSTQRWDQRPEAMSTALKRHDSILQHAIEANGGYVFKTVGDAFCAAFPTTAAALQAALDAQHSLHAEVWGASEPLKVRVALHVGAAEERDGDYFGPPVNRVARLLSAGHGGQVLLSDPAYDLVRDNLPTGVQVRDMGEYRLKDLFRPERIYQVTAPGLPQEFPPLKTLDNQPNNLPIQPTPLIGREKAAAAAHKLLMRGDVRLLTLTGPGGTGKTRLALQVGADLLDSFKDGVWFVELAPLTDSNLVVSTIAQTLGVKEAAGQPLLDTLAGYLQSKQLLLILDNFEQIVDAAPQVGRLLAGASGLKVVATSRVPLRVRGEHEYSVPPLELPDPKRLPPLERLSQYEAVRLFIERAQAVKTGFEIDNDNAPAVAEICARLDGLPLAIELAAARVRLLPPQAMLSRLQDEGRERRLKLLTGGARDLPARQQTLRDTIEWSYDLLNEGEKQLFRRMAVFQGGRTLEALEAVCNANGDLQVDVLDGAESLVSKSLLQQREGRDGEPRFWMLETIHEYARDKIHESEEADALHREHALYFMALAEAAEPHLLEAKQAEWFGRLEEDHDNMRAALRWCREQSEEEELATVEIGLRLAGALYRFWYVRGYFSEGREQLGVILDMSGPSRVPNVHDSASASPSRQKYRAKALNMAGDLVRQQGDYATARLLHEESLLMGRELGDKRGIATSLNYLGQVAYNQGDYEKANTLHEQSLGLRRELRDKRGIATSLFHLGNVAISIGDYDTARSLHEESLAIRRELGGKIGIANSLLALGAMIYCQGDYVTARPLLEESLAIYREVGDRRGTALSLNNLGNVAYSQGDYANAATLYRESLIIRRELGHKQNIAVSLVGLGAVAVGTGQAERGAKLLGAAEALLEAISAVLDPDDRIPYEQGVVSARANLGEKAFEKARSEGRAMSMKEAIAYALEATQDPPGDTPT